MDTAEEKIMRQALSQIQYGEFRPEEKITRQLEAFNGCVRNYKIRDKFAEIVEERDRNLGECNKCLGFCCCPVRCCWKGARIVFWATVVLIIVSCIFYLAYMFLAKRVK